MNERHTLDEWKEIIAQALLNAPEASIITDRAPVYRHHPGGDRTNDVLIEREVSFRWVERLTRRE